MCSLDTGQQHFLIDLIPPPQPIPKATQIKCNEGDNRLAITLAMDQC